MEVAELEAEMSRLDAIFRPVAKGPMPEGVDDIGAAIDAQLAELAVGDRAEAVLRAALASYAEGGDDVRAAIRRLFDKYPSFRWAAHLPRDAGFRAHLIHMSARDQGADTRDEILQLRALCDHALRAGVDVGPILDEVAAISSDVDRYGMGSMRDVLLQYGQRRPAQP